MSDPDLHYPYFHDPIWKQFHGVFIVTKQSLVKALFKYIFRYIDSCSKAEKFQLWVSDGYLMTLGLPVGRNYGLVKLIHFKRFFSLSHQC